MDVARRPILPWLLLFILMLGMVVPVSLWRAHALHHGADGVAAFQSHIHQSDDGVAGPDRSVPDDASQGHDHMPGVIAAQMAMPASGLALHAPLPVDAPWFELTTDRWPIYSTHTLRRPPRLG